MRQVPPRNTIALFGQKKAALKPICMVTCYDYPSACMINETDIDCVLVGDSVAMAVHGYDSTLHADMEMMCLHTRAVARGLSAPFLIADIPFLQHRQGVHHLIQQAQCLLLAGAQAVKLEGGDEQCCEGVRALTQAGIPVMGHLGLTPQSVHALGGHRVQGRLKEQADKIQQQALALQQAGCFALVLECIPQALAGTITRALDIATIGIGAGLDTDGQVLVWHDLLGLQDTFLPRFVQQYCQAKPLMVKALQHYVSAVQTRHFPAEHHGFEGAATSCK